MIFVDKKNYEFKCYSSIYCLGIPLISNSMVYLCLVGRRIIPIILLAFFKKNYFLIINVVLLLDIMFSYNAYVMIVLLLE